ncbi:MAG: hypothetical protein KF880_00020 [Ferruginibacter sp.]|nr:hypothetical protein [Ferruginibacter sp.]
MKFKARIEKCVAENISDDFDLFKFSKSKIFFTNNQKDNEYYIDSFGCFPFSDKSSYKLVKIYDSDFERDVYLIDMLLVRVKLKLNWYNKFKMKWIHRLFWIQQPKTKQDIYIIIATTVITFIVTFLGTCNSSKNAQNNFITITKYDTEYVPIKLSNAQQAYLDSIEWNRIRDSAALVNPYHIPKEFENHLDFRLGFYNGNEDLGYRQATINLFKELNGTFVKQVSSNIVAYDTPIYLSEGRYKIEIKTALFPMHEIELVVTQADLNLKKTMHINFMR